MTESLWFYYKDEATNFDVDTVNTNLSIIRLNYYKTIANGNSLILKNVAIALSLKHLSNFLRSLEMPLINCKTELKLRWTKHCILASVCVENDVYSDNIFTIKDTKLYVPVVTLSVKDNQKLSKFLSKGFERLFCWNEFKTKS